MRGAGERVGKGCKPGVLDGDWLVFLDAGGGEGDVVDADFGPAVTARVAVIGEYVEADLAYFRRGDAGQVRRQFLGGVD